MAMMDSLTQSRKQIMTEQHLDSSHDEMTMELLRVQDKKSESSEVHLISNSQTVHS